MTDYREHIVKSFDEEISNVIHLTTQMATLVEEQYKQYHSENQINHNEKTAEACCAAPRVFFQSYLEFVRERFRREGGIAVPGL